MNRPRRVTTLKPTNPTVIETTAEEIDAAPARRTNSGAGGATPTQKPAEKPAKKRLSFDQLAQNEKASAARASAPEPGPVLFEPKDGEPLSFAEEEANRVARIFAAEQRAFGPRPKDAKRQTEHDVLKVGSIFGKWLMGD